MEEYYALMDRIWRELMVIPAPSHHEEKRAQYISDLLLSWGLCPVVDEAKNVVLRVPGERAETVMFAAHTDTVFPDTEPMHFTEDENNIHGPGCGDDTASVAMLLAVIKYLTDHRKKPQKTVIFAFDACEEGLGNLDGVKALMKEYGKSVTEFYAFDGRYDNLAAVSVGSHRYRVTVNTEGGHSYGAFGNQNAAEVLSRGICKIYDIKTPQEGGKTTYNVGIISGGTSVNSIVQEASMLCEYRSVSFENLAFMKQKFEEVFQYMRSLGAEVSVELVGERPCMKHLDETAMQKLTDFCLKVQKKHSGGEVKLHSSSTDCNIPHSMGIPAICVGTYKGGGAHTREEWVEKKSMPIGFEIVREIVEHYFD